MLADRGPRSRDPRLTEIEPSRYDVRLGDRGSLIFAESDEQYDFERLDRAVRALVAQARDLRGENAALRDELAGHEQQVRELDEKLLAAHQLRQDAIKRIDDLVDQLDHVDSRLDSALKLESS